MNYLRDRTDTFQRMKNKSRISTERPSHSCCRSHNFCSPSIKQTNVRCRSRIACLDVDRHFDEHEFTAVDVKRPSRAAAISAHNRLPCGRGRRVAAFSRNSSSHTSCGSRTNGSREYTAPTYARRVEPLRLPASADGVVVRSARCIGTLFRDRGFATSDRPRPQAEAGCGLLRCAATRHGGPAVDVIGSADSTCLPGNPRLAIRP